MSETNRFTAETRAAVRATLIEVKEGTPLWSFSGEVIVRNLRIDVGWPFASWALTAWVKGGLVDFVSDDTWTPRSLPAPKWVELASIARGVYVLARTDALELAADFGRWRDDVDGVVEAIPSPSAPGESDDWIHWLVMHAPDPPNIGPDVVSRAEARTNAAIDTSDLNRWYIFPARGPKEK